ncbi:helix-turn-helix transcriptional regulator [Propionibacteriaceae bacterium G1746]|uniref:helix-turn-helix transcriptional regulator n=1 Tax=Aestuariimicrobium sp. G57 TaxID=3418485 RepID=UPI003C149CDB
MILADDSPPSTGTGAPRVRRSLDGERLLAVFGQLVEPLGRSLPATSEVVLHDLSLLPNSIVAIHGNVTGRVVGDPATDLLLERIAAKQVADSFVNYETVLPDGRRLRSSTMIIRDVAQTPVAALCINTDTSAWQTVEVVARAMLGTLAPDDAQALVSPDVPSQVPMVAQGGPAAGGGPHETFVRDIDELAQVILTKAIDETGVPVELMHKRHKVDVVRQLEARGLFLLKDAVELAAHALQVTRFTIYNYLNEIHDQAQEEDDRKASNEV